MGFAFDCRYFSAAVLQSVKEVLGRNVSSEPQTYVQCMVINEVLISTVRDERGLLNTTHARMKVIMVGIKNEKGVP